MKTFIIAALFATVSAVKVADEPRNITGVHDNAVHINTALGGLPTCTGADADVPETNCTNRKKPKCNKAGTNGTPDVTCTRPIPMCNGLPGTNGHPGTECYAPALPTCGPVYGGQPGIDCKVRTGDEKAPKGTPGGL